MKYQNRIVGNGEESLDQIMFNPRNWRIHPLHQQDALKGVLEEVGWVQQVIVNKRTGNLIDGHLRCQLAAREGNDTIPVVYVDLSEEEEALILSTLDPIAGMAATDKEKLDDLFRQFNSDNENVQKLIADIAEKEKLEFGKKPIEDAEPQIDKAEELRVKWGVETGQLWKLGEHRIICGDCTDKAVVDKVMQGEVADLVFTSPPYGSKSGNLSGVPFYGQDSKDTFQDHTGFLCDFMKLCRVNDDSPVLVNLSYNDNNRIGLFEFAVSKEHGFNLYETFVWKKLRSMPLKGDNISRLCEFIFLFSRGRYKIPTRSRINEGLFNFYESSKEFKQGHGNLAAFPVDLPEHFLSIFSLENNNVYEPFCGTGTTIIACERLGRKCRAVEISPAYVAVALQRWVDVTGGVPELIEQIE